MSEVLNCDAPGCGHVEEVGTITGEMVGMPCPSCGANLLAEEDWQAWQPIQAIMRAAEKMSEKHGEVTGKASLGVSLKGGTTTIKIEREIDG
jgi:hypothetical protein